MLIVLGIFVPFTTETIKCYQYFKANAPLNYVYPGLDAFWLTAVTTVLTLVLERVVSYIFYPIILANCKE